MIEKIYIYPRQVVENILASDRATEKRTWALISIYGTPDRRLLNTPELHKKLQGKGCARVLELCFGDFSKETYDRLVASANGRDRMLNSIDKKFYLFNEDQAKKTVEFLDKIYDDPQIKRLVVHCQAGVSRSAAVGVFACRRFKMDENALRKEHPHAHPNAYVYDLLYRVSGMRDDYIRFWEEPPKGIIKVNFVDTENLF